MYSYRYPSNSHAIPWMTGNGLGGRHSLVPTPVIGRSFWPRLDILPPALEAATAPLSYRGCLFGMPRAPFVCSATLVAVHAARVAAAETATPLKCGREDSGFARPPTSRCPSKS